MKKPFPKGCPVTVVVSLRDAYEFANLDEAKQAFPDLDPDINGKRFTWAMHGRVAGVPAMRFESWDAYEIFSR
jgi:hypothetical protein